MQLESREFLAARIRQLPHNPGVYLFKDKEGKVIYVGKALDLRQRVRSYMQKPARSSPRLKALVSKIASFSYIVTDSESEAFMLESNLIKEYAPRYNVQFKDDKHYPYLRLTLEEPFPRLEVARRIEGKGSKYFGPYSKAGAMRETIRMIKKIFPLRSCRQPLAEGERKARPCLNYQIKRCLAPCIGAVSTKDYASLVEQVALFLEGKQLHLLRELEKEMQEAAEALHFEKAARLRDQYFSLQKIMERQKAVSNDGKDRDVIVLVELPETGFAVGLFRIRGGRLLAADHFIPRGTEGADPPEIIKEFLRHYYDHATFVPGELLLSHEPLEKELLLDWLQKKNNKRVKIKVPQRGEKKALLELVKKNTVMHLQHEQDSSRQREHSLEELGRLLGLREPPQRIEGYDISHFAGKDTVGSLVVFLQGRPWKDGYRRFKIRRAGQSDDYAALREVLQRRLENEKLPLPSLILLDGGRGQLSAARAVLEAKGLSELPLLALAKEQEHIFLPTQKAPLVLPANHPALKLLQRVRDEAHRFALSLNRNLTVKNSLTSLLEAIPGIGPVRRKALLKHFSGLDSLLEASIEEIASVQSMNSAVAQRLYRELHKNNRPGSE